MASFDPMSAAIGGALIGVGTVLLMLLNGRIAGISGIFADLIGFDERDKGWRAAFILGLVAAPLVLGAAAWTMPQPNVTADWTTVIIGGLLVGFGTRLGGGCTSGHGLCGFARLSPRSLVATVIFMLVAMVVVAMSRHVLGG